MKIRFGVSFGFLLVIAVLTAFSEERVHTVQRGETLYSIARSQGIKAEDLMKHNGITDPSRLQAGQRIKIPVASSTENKVPVQVGTGSNASYRVARGETFYSIARKYSVTVEALRGVNSLPDNYVLREGDSLKLPVEARLSTETIVTPETRVSSGTAPARQVSQSRTDPKESSASQAAAAIPQVSWPVAARELSHMTGKLSGVVITGVRAESVKSLTRGTVLSAGPYRGFGRVVIIQVDGGYLYVYGGCESLSVKEGDKVSPGTEIGKLGIDSVTNKPQLFFMVYRNNTPVDPAKAPRA